MDKTLPVEENNLEKPNTNICCSRLTQIKASGKAENSRTNTN